MKRLAGLFSLLLVSALAAVGCGNSVDAVPNPTPTPTETPTVTPTPTPGDRSGIYAVSAAQPTVSCNLGAVFLTFNATTVDLVVGATDFTPDWGFNTSTTFSLPDPEHGTISGDSFTANYTYCDYNGLADLTTKHVATWTGTFNMDGTFDSTLTQKLRNATGNQVLTCGATESGPDVTTPMGDCSTTGISWAIHGVPQ